MEYLFTLGLGLFILGIWSLKNRMARIKRGIKSIATIVELKKDNDSDKLYKPIFKFITHRNEEIIYEHSSSGWVTWSIGEKVKVVYTAEKPHKIILLTLFNAFGVSITLITVALILLFITGGYYWSQYFFNSLQ